MSDALRGATPSGWTATEVSVRLRRGAGGAVRVEGVLCSAPVWFRWDGVTLWLVGSGASPVGEDHIRVRVDVGSGLDVTVRSVAATVVYAARGVGTRWDTDLHVADGARLVWRPEPVILTERARHVATNTVHAGPDADVTFDETLVLGRNDEATGDLRSTLDVRVDGSPVLLTSIDTSLPGWAGPAGTDGSTVIANRLRLQPSDGGDQPVEPPATRHRTPGATLLRPDARCLLAVATGSTVSGAERSRDAVLPG